MEDCTDPKCPSAGRSHGHIQLSEEDIAHYKALHQVAQLSSAGAEIERTRNVSIHNYSDLLDHMKSHNGHSITYAEWRSGHDDYDDHIPGVRPKNEDAEGDEDKLTHRELIAAHEEEHRKYAQDYPHTTLDGEHFHH
jgi:hypothetical protein